MTIDISEQQRIIEGLTAVIANQHIEIVRCHDRINELLRFNNEFEERARRAERRINKVIEWIETVPIGLPLMQAGKPIDHTALNDLKQGL